MTSIQPQFEEKRFALRMALRLPVVVSGRTEDGAAWSEPTETDDISTLGALFQLNQTITQGDSLKIRAHRPNGTPVEVKARVVRVIPAKFGTARSPCSPLTAPTSSTRSVTRSTETASRPSMS